MSNNIIDSTVYLKRLGLEHERPSLDFLNKIQRNHLIHIPFENLDIHYGGRKSLNMEETFQKIIPSRRGGYCFELNGLLYHLLSDLGFECYLTSASFYQDDGTFSRPMDHMLVIVYLDHAQYIVDVGEMDGTSKPKKIAPGEITLDGIRYYRFDQNPDEEYLLMRSSDHVHFYTYYKTDLKEKKLIEFLDVNNRHQDDPDSFFVKNLVVSRLDKNGNRIKLTNRTFKRVVNGKIQESKVDNEQQFLSWLEQFFGIRFRN